MNTYLVVTTDALLPSIPPLVAQKRNLGYTVETATCKQIAALFPNEYLQDAIRSYVLGKFSGLGATYCLLLVGDRETVPGYIISDPRVDRYNLFVCESNHHLSHLWSTAPSLTWEDKGGDLYGIYGGAAAVAWGRGRLDIFARSSTNTLAHLYYDHGWGNWENKGGNLTSDPVVCSWGRGRLDIFVRGQDNHLNHLSYNNGWRAWEDLGGSIASTPAVISKEQGRIDVFAQGTDNCLKHLSYDSQWGNWEDKGGSVASVPAVVSWGKGRLDIFVRGSDKHLKHLWREDTWGSWEDLGGNILYDPVATSWSKGRLDIFASGNDHHLKHLWYASGWGRWEDKGGDCGASPIAVAWGTGRFDVFVRSSNSHLQHLSYANGWSAWVDMGGNITNPVAITQWVGFDSDNFFSMHSENDIAPVFLTGRISSNDPQVVKKVCQLLAIYPGHLDPSWTGRTILTGWAPRGNDVPQAAKDLDPGWQCVKEIGERYEIIQQFEDSPSYDRSSRDTWAVSGNTRAKLANKIEQGVAIIRYVGHGTETSWVNIGAREWFTVQDVSNLPIPQNPPFVFSFTCLTGDIETPVSFAEAWQTQLKAAGVLASDEVALGSFMDAFPQVMYRQLISRKRRRIGEAIQAALIDLYQNDPSRYDPVTAKMLRYFGDPDTLLPLPAARVSPVAMTSWGTNRLDIFTLGPTNLLMHLWYDVGGWGHWEDKGGNLVSAPAVVAWAPNRLDIFGRSQDNHLQHLWYQGRWGSWEDKGGNLASDPVAVSWGPGRLDIFARSQQNTLLHLWFENGWGQWEDKGGNLASDPVAVSWGPGRLDIFARSQQNTLLHLWFENGWGHWEDKGGELLSNPAAACWGSGRLDIFARSKQSTLIHLWFENGWGQWEDKGGSLTTDPSVVAWSKGRLDIFARGNGSFLAYLKYSVRGWGQWENKGGPCDMKPIVVSWGPGRLDILTRDSDLLLQHIWFQRAFMLGVWGSWENLTPSPTIQWH